MFEYWGFGLTISSEICFPELLEKEFKTTPDVKISIGNIPDYLQEKAETTRLFYLVKDKIFLLNIK
ncbi:MAG: hypothetical protein LKI53_09685, partial [Bacteroidales bacterium]|nr:hypothetical protein [Bacteroidales bacterium]